MPCNTVLNFRVTGWARFSATDVLCLTAERKYKQAACADHWAAFPFQVTDQDSFRAIIGHPYVTLWYLSSLPPHAVAAFLSMAWASHFSHKQKTWEDGENLLPGFLEEGCDGTWLPVEVPQELRISKHHLCTDKTGICSVCKQILLYSICSHRPVQELKAGMEAEILISSCHGRSWTLRLRLPKI